MLAFYVIVNVAYLYGKIIIVNVIVEYIEAKIQLSGTQSKTGTDTKKCSQNWNDINDIAHPTKDSIPNQRIKARFHGHW